MNTIKNIVTAIIFLCGIISFAQVVEGKVIYKVTLNNEAYLEKFKKESTLEEKYKKMNIENMSNTNPIHFFLFFKGNESVYKAEFDLDEQRDMGMKWNETGVLANVPANSSGCVSVLVMLAVAPFTSLTLKL